MGDPEPKGLTPKSAFILPGGHGVPRPARLQGFTWIRCKYFLLWVFYDCKYSVVNIGSNPSWDALRSPRRAVPRADLPFRHLTYIGAWPDVSFGLTLAVFSPGPPRTPRAQGRCGFIRTEGREG